MTAAILSFFQNLPPALTTVIIAAIPIVEVRGAVPVALEVFHLPVVTAALLSFLGSVIPALIIPSILQAIEAPCRRASKTCARFLDWTAHHVEKRYTQRYRALGAIGLTIFVAIPLPLTGVWTGALAAWLFRIPKRYAIPALILGTACTTLIMTALTMGGFAVGRALF